ncbi:hypothetical protein PIROE2DRAFT_17027, partial [Piromyces sp. E2]
LCIFSNHTIDNNCYNGDSDKFLCKDESQPCKYSKNTCNPREKSNSCDGFYLTDIKEDTGSGDLYKCTRDKSVDCILYNKKGFFKITDNYYLNNIKYIQCDNVSCKNVELSEDSIKLCNSTGYSTIINNNSNEKKCQNNIINLSFSEPGKKYKQLIKVDKNDIVFNQISNHKYEILSISEDSITQIDLSKIYNITNLGNNNVKFKKLKLNGLYGFKDDTSVIDEGMDILIEDKEYNDNFSKIINDIKLYHCKNYECKETSGFIKYYDNKIVKVANCSPKCDSKYNSKDCKTGNAYYLNTESKFNLCVNINNKLRPQEIYKNQLNFIFNNTINGQNIYDLYITNNYGNIIGLSLYKSTHFLDVDNNEKVVLICDEVNDKYICRKTNKPGYYVNDDKDDYSENLIFCNEDRECDISEESNGYFINSLNTDVIRCSNEKCKVLKKKGSTCENNENTVIVKNNKLLYCNYLNEVEFKDYEQYHKLENINLKLVYPRVQKGFDTMLLKIDKYSVTQYYNTYGICINSNFTLRLSNIKNNEDVDLSKEKVNCLFCLSKNESCYSFNFGLKLIMKMNKNEINY